VNPRYRSANWWMHILTDPRWCWWARIGRKRAKYKVAVVDFSDPENPEVDTLLDVDVSPYYGYWWYLPYMPMVDMATSDAAVGLWYPLRQQGSSCS